MFLEIEGGIDNGSIVQRYRVEQINEVLAVKRTAEYEDEEVFDMPAMPARAYKEYDAPKSTPRQPALTAAQIVNRKVVTLLPSSPIGEARILMKKKEFHHTPVVSDVGRVVGIVSDRDLLVLPETDDDRLVGEVMTKNLIAATLDTEIRDIAQVMVCSHVHCLLILSGDETLEGIITSADVLKCIVNRAPLDLWV